MFRIWLKFNPNKSNIIEFGKQIITKNSFEISGIQPPLVDEIF